jgi:hypothetical protein
LGLTVSRPPSRVGRRRSAPSAAPSPWPSSIWACDGTRPHYGSAASCSSASASRSSSSTTWPG